MKTLKGRLYYISEDGRGLYYKGLTFFDVNLENGEKTVITRMPIGGIKWLLSRIRVCNRLLRLEPRCVERLTDNMYVVCFLQKIWLLDLHKKTCSELLAFRNGFSNPLDLCSDGDAVYWGEYGNNETHRQVNVYKLKRDLSIETIYSFEPGIIRHIHNIVWDSDNRRFFVLTGDLEDTSGIYEANEDWSKVKPIVTGKQQYRAVVAFPYSNGLIYATDSVVEKNNIYHLQNGDVSVIATFPGSCIYGTETKDYYVFASTVEPPEGRGFLNMLTYKLGAGIEDRYSHLISVRKCDLQVKEITRLKKDFLPMKLFQYGSIMFPNVINADGNALWYYSMACKGDGKTKMVKIEEEL